MTPIRSHARQGFTLVEILIVVIILGILAAIVIPQFSNASSNARVSSLQSTLQTLRSQIELYKLQHGDNLPNIVASWTAMTQGSSYGNPVVDYIPYLQTTPINPLNSNSNVVDAGVNLETETPSMLSALAVSSCGFIFDYEGGLGSGDIYATDTTGTAIAGTGSGANFIAY
jgi:type II secretion system protein G